MQKDDITAQWLKILPKVEKTPEGLDEPIIEPPHGDAGNAGIPQGGANGR